MLAFLMLGLAYLMFDAAGPNIPLLRAGGAFGIIAAFAAWYACSLSLTIANYMLTMWFPGTMPSLVWPTPQTPSSSSQSYTSHGPRRAVSDAERLTTARPALPSRFKR